MGEEGEHVAFPCSLGILLNTVDMQCCDIDSVVREEDINTQLTRRSCLQAFWYTYANFEFNLAFCIPKPLVNSGISQTTKKSITHAYTTRVHEQVGGLELVLDLFHCTYPMSFGFIY